MNKFIYILIFALTLSSCSTKQPSNNNYSKTPKNSKELISMVNSKNKNIEWLSLRGKINVVKENQDITLSVNIKHRKDSVIWLSISAPFGIEIIRAQATPDSIYFLNRTKKTWFVEPSNQIKNFLKYEISFENFQDMITANPIILKNKYKIKIQDEGFALTSEFCNYLVSKDFRIKNANFIDGENRVNFSYASADNTESFPAQFSLKVNSQEQFEANLTYSKVVINTPLKISFKIPKSYVEQK
tara:strand:- start:415 stop:1143 length:729 start_codon:yes stop_codon:yes gene_type:complete